MLIAHNTACHYYNANTRGHAVETDVIISDEIQLSNLCFIFFILSFIIHPSSRLNGVFLNHADLSMIADEGGHI